VNGKGLDGSLGIKYRNFIQELKSLDWELLNFDAFLKYIEN